MSTQAPTPDHDGQAVSMHTMESVVAALLFAIGASVAYSSWNIGARWADDGPQAGYFPFYIGVIICACSLVILLQAVTGKLGENKSFVDRGPLRQVMSVLMPATFYVLGIQLIGIYVASAIYITVFMVWLGRYSWLRGLVLGVAVSAVAFVMFEVWFQVPLFKGSLFNPLGFLGY